MGSDFATLDAHSIHGVMALLAFGLLALSASQRQREADDRHGHAHFGVSMAYCGAALGLYFLTGHIPALFSLLLANWCVLQVLPHAWLACSKALNRGNNRTRQWMVTSTFLGISGTVATYFLDASRAVSIVTVSLALAFQAATLLQEALRLGNPHPPVRKLIMAVLGAYAATMVGRAGVAVFGDYNVVLPIAHSAAFSLVLLSSCALIAFGYLTHFGLVQDRLKDELAERMRRDGLTGVYTRSAFMEMTPELEMRARKQTLSVLMIDIDHFKAINDTYGHQGGDVVLAHVGRFLANSQRLSDLAVRYGGEEFCLLLWDCDAAATEAFAERLVVAAAKQQVRIDATTTARLTLSVGYAVCTSGPAFEGLDYWIGRADAAVYRAKRTGRNRAVSDTAALLAATQEQTPAVCAFTADANSALQGL